MSAPSDDDDELDPLEQLLRAILGHAGEAVPRSRRVELHLCGNPSCGIHIVPFGGHGNDEYPLCEIILSVEHARSFASEILMHAGVKEGQKH